VNSTFQQQLKQLTFKTFYHNRTETFDYDNLFSARRVIVFSITQMRTICSAKHIQSYIDNYDYFLKNGIDDVYVVDSTDRLVGPHMDKKTSTIKGLFDDNMRFVELLGTHYDYQKLTVDLARFWQYVIIINDGEPEKFWNNPFKEDSQLVILKDPAYRYRKLSAGVVLKYLIDNPQ
jgi:peroxiredoxin